MLTLRNRQQWGIIGHNAPSWNLMFLEGTLRSVKGDLVHRTTHSVPRQLATTPELAAHYGVPEKTIHRWHQTQTCIGPLMFRVGRYLRARWDDIDAYDANQAGGQRAA